MREKLAEPRSATQVAIITLDKPKTENDLKLRLNSCVFPIRCMSTASALTPVLMPSPSGLSRPSWGVCISITSFLDIVARVEEKNERRKIQRKSWARESTKLSSELQVEEDRAFLQSNRSKRGYSGTGSRLPIANTLGYRV